MSVEQDDGHFTPWANTVSHNFSNLEIVARRRNDLETCVFINHHYVNIMFLYSIYGSATI